MLKKTLFILLIIFCEESFSQSFLNGDFEINTAGTDQINLFNYQYNSFMSNSVAFGNWNGGGANGGDMDIISSATYCGLAQNGSWYIAFTSGGSDAVSLTLSSPLIAGNSYTFTFYDRICDPYTGSPIQIGVSNVDTTLGTIVYTAPTPVPNVGWTQRTCSFVAPISALYISVSCGGINSGSLWTQVDNFSFGGCSFNLNLGNDTTLCQPATLALNATTPSATYLWQDNSTNPTYTVTQQGTYWVEVTTSACSKRDTIYVNYTTIPTVHLGNDTTICQGASLSLFASGALTYKWTPGNTLNDSTIANPVATPTGTTNYIVSGYNGGGCVDRDTITITVHPPINIAKTAANISCNGACNGQINVVPSGGTSPYSYNWTGGCASASCNNLCAGSYTVTVTDALGCIAIADTIITEPSALLASVTGSSPTSCSGACVGSATTLATGGTQGTGYTYSWNTVPVQNTATAIGLCAGTYTCTVTDINGCTKTTTVTITQSNGITLTTTSTQTDCSQNTGTATATATGGNGGYTYLWNPSGQTTQTATGLGAGSYTVTVTSANGCTQTQAASVTGFPNPVITASATEYHILAGNSTQLNASVGGNYNWVPATGLNCDTCQNPIASPVQTTTYCVITTDSHFCSDSACVTINVEQPCPTEFTVPNAFSPNNDGHNDAFCLQGWTKCVMQFSIIIYDRWGEKVFESTDPGFCWDGSYAERSRSIQPATLTSTPLSKRAEAPMNSAVFVYSINAALYSGEKISRKGNISLIR